MLQAFAWKSQNEPGVRKQDLPKIVGAVCSVYGSLVLLLHFVLGFVPHH